MPKFRSLKHLTYEELHLRGKGFYNKGFIKQAIKPLKAAIAKQPQNFKSHNMLGIVYKNLEMNREALKCLTKSIALSKKYAYYGYNNRGIIYRKIEKYDLAISDFNASLKQKPTWATTYSNRGVAYRTMGRYTEAERDYKKAISLKPRSRTYKFNLASLYFAQGDNVRAMEQCIEAIALAPKNVNTNVLLAHLHMASKNYAEASTVLMRLYESQPQNPELLFTFLTLQLLKKDPDIKKYVKLLKEIERPNRHALKYLSAGQFLLSNYDAGISTSQRSFKAQMPNNKVKLYNLLRRLPLLLKKNSTEQFTAQAGKLVDRKNQQWVDSITLYILGELPEKDLKLLAFTKERSFEFHFYKGIKQLLANKPAKLSFQAALAIPVNTKVEWLYARKLLNDME